LDEFALFLFGGGGEDLLLVFWILMSMSEKRTWLIYDTYVLRDIDVGVCMYQEQHALSFGCQKHEQLDLSIEVANPDQFFGSE